VLSETAHFQISGEQRAVEIVAGAVDLSTDAALAPTSAAAAPTGANTAALARATCYPSCRVRYQRYSLFKKPQCRWLHSRDIGYHDA